MCLRDQDTSDICLGITIRERYQPSNSRKPVAYLSTMPIIDVGERADPVPAPTLSGLPHDIPIDHRPIPALAMIVIKIYAFGGLAFLVGTVLTGISWWIWVVIINREYADSPPWLDLNPEVGSAFLLFVGISYIDI